MSPLDRALDPSPLVTGRVADEHAASRQRGDTARHSRLCVGVGFSFIILLVAGAIAMALVLRAAALADAGRTLEQLSGAAAEQVAQSFRSIDLVLQDVEHRIETAAARRGEPVDVAIRSPDIRDVLLETVRKSGQLASIAVASRSGSVVNWSRDPLTEHYSVADRDFFRALLDDNRPRDMFISPPEISRATGDRTLFMSRRLGLSTGPPEGVVFGSVSLTTIDRSFADITRTRGVVVTLLFDRGAIIARSPGNDFAAGGVEKEADYLGQLTSSRLLPETGMRLVVSMTVDQALLTWHRQALGITMLTLVASGCVSLMIWALLQQMRAQQSVQSALSDRNLDLLAANERVERQSVELAATATALRINDKLLADRSATLNTTLEYIDQGIMMVDAGGRVVVFNRRVSELLDIPEALLARNPTFDEVLAHQQTQGEFTRSGQDVVAFVQSGGMATTPHRYQRERPNGQIIEIRSLPLPGGGMVRTYSDITERKRAQATIERAALVDDLTSLPNRLSLRRELDRRLQDKAAGVALLYVNLDRFRLLNDARGHVTGDAMLRGVADRLREAVPPGDMVSRTGGDEFAVLHLIKPTQDDSSELSAHLLRLLGEPYLIDDQRLTITVSIGVAIASAGNTTDMLLRNADIAMYRAKDGGRNQLCRYEPAMAAAQQERFQIEQSMREALGTPAFRLAFQPIIELSTNAIAGFEALLRWNDPVRGEIPPSCFIPIAETTGLIVPLGKAALDWACAEVAGWSKPYTIAVNLSPAQFLSEDLVHLVKMALSQSGLAAHQLELEVTEGMLLQDTGPVKETMFALRDLGVSLTLDDFGTGHAGLSYLRRFPFQKFKIDRSFVRNLGQAREADTIVEEMLLLARRLDLRVVAEGVELESQLDHLRELGCDYVQGYLTGRPVPAEVARTL